MLNEVVQFQLQSFNIDLRRTKPLKYNMPGQLIISQVRGAANVPTVCKLPCRKLWIVEILSSQ